MAKKRVAKKQLLGSIGDDIIISINDRSNKIQKLNINNKFEMTDMQHSFVETIKHYKTNMVFCNGPAGVAKTYLSILAGLELLNRNSIEQIVYIRSVAESAAKSLGFLPGEASDKFDPFVAPLMDKLEELLPIPQMNQLISDGVIRAIPNNYLRGTTFRNSLVVIDEYQNLTYKELVTILTRIGEGTKYVILGDPMQSDIGSNSKATELFNKFNDSESEENGIFTFEFTENEIVRSDILKFIVKKLSSELSF